MKDFVVSIEDTQALVFKPDNKNKILARVEFPELQKEIFLPVKFKILQGKEKVGELEAWMPRENRLGSRLGENISHVFEENKQLKMKTRDLVGGNDGDFQIGDFDLSHFQDKAKKEAKKHGFQKGYSIKRNREMGQVHLYKKGESKRVLLRLDEELEWPSFLALALFDEIVERLEKKKEVKNELPPSLRPTRKPVIISSQKAPSEKKKEGKGLVSYREFVLASYPMLKEEKAVEYIDQKGEWEQFHEFIERKKPVLLNGPTGTGKDTMIRCYAYQEDLPFFKCQGHQQMKMRDLEGMWTMTGDKPVKSPGPLVLAAVFGGICYIEEIGPILQEILYGLHSVLERREIVIHSQYGYEKIKAHPEMRIVASGNLDRRYTLNEFNDAFLERWVQIKLDYPDKEKSIEIIKSVTGVDEQIAEMLTDITIEMREILVAHGEKDMGLRGAIEVANALMANTDQYLRNLIEVCMINPKATYEEVGLRKKLRDVADKHLNKGAKKSRGF